MVGIFRRCRRVGFFELDFDNNILSSLDTNQLDMFIGRLRILPSVH